MRMGGREAMLLVLIVFLGVFVHSVSGEGCGSAVIYFCFGVVSFLCCYCGCYHTHIPTHTPVRTS